MFSSLFHPQQLHNPCNSSLVNQPCVYHLRKTLTKTTTTTSDATPFLQRDVSILVTVVAARRQSLYRAAESIRPLIMAPITLQRTA